MENVAQRIAEVVDEFADLDGREKLELLVDYAAGLEPLDREHEARKVGPVVRDEVVDGHLRDLAHVVVPLLHAEAREAERRLPAAPVLLRQVDRELVEDLARVAAERAEERACDFAFRRASVSGRSVGRLFSASTGSSREQLSSPFPSMTMKPYLASVSRSSASASVWNLLSQR